MEMRMLRRQAMSCCSSALAASGGILPSISKLNLTPFITRRSKATTSRSKRALNIPPHPSFLAPGDGKADRIIFNPPSAAPSVYQTPFKFLPASDPRRRANLASIFASSTSIQYNVERDLPNASNPSATTGENNLPPAIRPNELKGKSYNLTKEDVEEMRRMRLEDPDTWSVTALARRFKCPKLFIIMVVSAPRSYMQRKRQEMEEVQKRWGPRKVQAREERRRRLTMLFTGQD